MNPSTQKHPKGMKTITRWPRAVRPVGSVQLLSELDRLTKALAIWREAGEAGEYIAPVEKARHRLAESMDNLDPAVSGRLIATCNSMLCSVSDYIPSST